MIHFYLNSYKTPACKAIRTGIVTQELLHRSSANFKVIKLYLNSCKIRLLRLFYFSPAISLRRHGQPGGGLRNVTLCGVSDTQTCGEMRVLFVLGQPLCGDRACRMGKHVVLWNVKLLCPQQPSAEIVPFEHASMWWNVNFFWARATLCRDRAGRTSKHVAECKFGGTRRSPFARNEGQPSKTGVKLWFWKFRCKRGMKVKRQ